MEDPYNEDPYNQDLIDNLNELHGLLLSEEATMQDTLERVAKLACATLDGCDAAGVTLVEDSEAITAAATNDFTLKIDRAQYENDEGPCLQAMRTQEVVLVEDIETDQRWPRFSEAAAKSGLKSSLSLPLTVRDRGVGSLNLYARTKKGFDDKSRSIGTLFASQASVALSNGEVYAASLKLAQHLQEAIKSREVIGEAKGILMEREGISDDDAFEMLKHISQNTNMKLRDIAQRVVDEAVKKP